MCSSSYFISDKEMKEMREKIKKEEDEEFNHVKQLIKDLRFIYGRAEFSNLKKATIEKLEKDGYNVIHKIDSHGFDDGYIVSWKKEKPSKFKRILKLSFIGSFFT